jgi:hypothetical protein
MKKILITMLSAATMVATSFAQGEIGFFNSAASAITVGNSSTKMFGSAGTYDFGLYLGSAGTTAIAQMQLVDLVLSPNSPSGLFNNGLFSANPTTVTSPGNVANTIAFAPGTQYAFYVAGWAAAGGSNYMTIPGGTTAGLSALGFVVPASGTQPVPDVFGTAAG